MKADAALEPVQLRLHARCAPSSASRWMECAGSVAMEDNEREETSKFAEEGTTAHDFAAKWLLLGAPDSALQSNEEMLENVAFYVEFVQSRVQDHYDRGATKVTLLVEQKLPLEDVTGERGATGTSDVVLLIEFAETSEIEVIDLKYGRGVEVSDDDPQLPIYSLGAMRKFGLMHEFVRVFTTVVQPRVNRSPQPIEHSIDEMETFAKVVMERATLALGILSDGPATALNHLKVSEKGCRFCKAKAKCPEIARHVHDTVFGEIQPIEGDKLEAIDETNFVGSRTDFAHLLPKFMDRVPVIEAWVGYIRAKVEQLLIEGKPVAGYKLVVGRSGARKWTSEDAVLPVMLGYHVPRELIMTPPELRSPADLEKKLKKTHTPAWNAVQGLIAQAPGKPSVATIDDPRPTFSNAVFDGDSYDAAGLV